MYNFVKYFTLIAVVVSLCSSCAKKKTLHVYIWADYISEEVVHRFEKQYNCRVRQDVFDSNEMMFAKLQSGGDGYDVLCPSHYYVGKMASSGMLAKLDKSRLPNLSHLDPKVTEKFTPGVLDYSVPYFMSYTGIGYNRRLLDDFKPTWDVFLREDLRDRMTLLDDYSEVLGAAVRKLGYTYADILGDPARAQETVAVAMEWRRNIIKFDNEQYKNGLATGEFLVVMGYFSDLSQIVAENDDLALALPEEGCMMSCDMLAISASAKEPDLAYEFINFVHDPANAAQNITDVYAYCPNIDAVPLLDEEVRSDESIFVSGRGVENAVFMPEFTESEAGVLNGLWSQIKSGNIRQ